MTAALAATPHDRLKRLPRPLLWALAARLKTLSLSLTPILAGSVLAAAQGHGRAGVLGAGLVAAAAIQIATNLWNDAADAENGTDLEGRFGPPRMTALGLLDAGAVRRGALAMALVAVLAGLWLVAVGGAVFLALGALSLALGYGYSLGPRPLAATPFGEILVVGFFGIVAVAGTAVLHGAPVTPGLIGHGVFLGLPAAAVLLVNNHRDRASDARSGRRTLAIALGGGGARLLYAALVLVAPVGLALLAPRCAGALLLQGLLLGGGVLLSWRMWTTPVSAALNRLLVQTALFQLGLFLALAASAFLCG